MAEGTTTGRALRGVAARAWWSSSSPGAGSGTRACSRRWARCRATASSIGALGRRGLRRSAAADRLRADDLAAVHGGAGDRAGGAAAERPRARGRGRLRLPGGRARASCAARSSRVEIVPALAGARARDAARTLGYRNVTVESFDGSGGWPEHAPYDVIIVSAGAPRIPPLLVDRAGRRRPAGDPGRAARGARTGGRAPRGRPLRHVV